MSSGADWRQNLAKIVRMTGEAVSRKADVVVFPELALTGKESAGALSVDRAAVDDAVCTISEAARRYGIYVVFGAPGIPEAGKDPRAKRWNSAYVIGPEGRLLTRYDQMVVDRSDIFQPGAAPATMWFDVKGVPAVVTIGSDARWSEISEMAAVAGAQLMFNLSSDGQLSTEAEQRRLQVLSNFASFLTFTVAVNTSGTTVWDDLEGPEEIRAAVAGDSRHTREETAIYAGFAANCVVRAGGDEAIFYAVAKTKPTNRYEPWKFNRRMAPWYWFGAQLITGEK